MREHPHSLRAQPRWGPSGVAETWLCSVCGSTHAWGLQKGDVKEQQWASPPGWVSVLRGPQARLQDKR